MKAGLFVGLSGLDIVYSIDVLPPENTKTKTNAYEIFIGGPAANAAITFSLLGGKAKLATCIGDSEYGKIIKRVLTEDYNIQVFDWMEGAAGLPGISSIAINPRNGNRTIWSGQQKTEVLKNLEGIDISDGNLFCLSDCSHPQAAISLLRQVREKTVAIVLDAGSWKEEMQTYLSLANEVIASAVCRVPDALGDLYSVSESSGVENVAVTNGADGVSWRSPSGSGIVYPPQVKAVDTLGAGDIFHGAYCYGRYVAGRSFAEALQFAAGISANSVQFFGPRRGVQEYVKLLP